MKMDVTILGKHRRIDAVKNYLSLTVKHWLTKLLCSALTAIRQARGPSWEHIREAPHGRSMAGKILAASRALP